MNGYRTPFMLGALAVIAGVALIAAVLVDMGLTVLHPTIRGPLSHHVTRLVWRLARAAALASRRRVVLEFAGPLVVVGSPFDQAAAQDLLLAPHRASASGQATVSRRPRVTVRAPARQ